ncbi:MAG: SLC13 family permease [Limisphaerales bacterium]
MEETRPPQGREITERRWRRGLLLGLSGVAAVAVTLLMVRAGVAREAALMAGIFVLAALLWVTEAIPLFATALLVVLLEVLLLANPARLPWLGFTAGDSPSIRDILNAAADPVLLLFLGGLALALAATKEGVDRVLSGWLLRPFGRRPAGLLLGVILVTAAFSAWMSNTATTAMMLALVAPLLAGLERGVPFRRALVLAVPFAANIGGLATPVGSPPNAVAIAFLKREGHELGFVEWMAAMLPLTGLLLLGLWWLLLRLHPAPAGELADAGPPPRLGGRGRVVVGIFAGTVVLWLTDRWHGVPVEAVALLATVALAVPGILGAEDVDRLEWNVLILIGGGLALGAGLERTGLDDWIVTRLPLGSAPAAWMLVAGLTVGALVLSTFMSNTAATNLVLPLAASALHAAGAGPASVVEAGVFVAVGGSLAMALPISTPPNALAYARGEITTRDMAAAGALVGVAGCALLLAAGPWWFRLLGLVE